MATLPVIVEPPKGTTDTTAAKVYLFAPAYLRDGTKRYSMFNEATQDPNWIFVADIEVTFPAPDDAALEPLPLRILREQREVVVAKAMSETAVIDSKVETIRKAISEGKVAALLMDTPPGDMKPGVLR